MRNTCAGLLLATLASACGSDPVRCGTMACGKNQECDPGSTPPTCRCQEAYTGTTCMSCARGYMMSGGQCVPIPINCQQNPTICGAHGMCVDNPASTNDSCTCSTGYAGRVCQICADGYQDNDHNGTCTVTCASMAATCLPPKMCTDASGTANCACPANTTGTNCEFCTTGYVREGDGACFATCAVKTCGTSSHCDDSNGPAACVCNVGYAGTDCAGCAAGFAPDGAAHCVPSVSAGTRLLGAGRYQGAETLVAIDPAAGTFVPLRNLMVANLQLAGDSGGTVYAASSSGVARIDLATGALVTLATITSTSSLSYHAGSLYTIPNLSPYLLKRIDVGNASVTDVGPTSLISVQDLGWDGANNVLLSVRSTGTSPELHRIDPATAVATLIGAVTLDPARLRSSDSKLGLAIDPASGHPFLAMHQGRLPQDAVADFCHKLARGLGLGDYDAAPVTGMNINYNGIGSGGTLMIQSVMATGKEIVAYVSYGNRLSARATLRIDTANPQTFLCMSTYEEVLGLSVSSNARFVAAAFTGYRPSISLAVDTGFPPVTQPTLHVHVASTTAVVDPSVRAYAVSRVYQQREWTDRRLADYVSAWDTDANAPGVLLELDRNSLQILRTLSFPDIELFPILASWAP